MARGATQSNGSKKQKHGQSFQPVFDSRKRKIPGLWQRGKRYYAQLRVDLGNGQTAPRRLALNAVNLDEAKGELERKRTERRDGKLPRTGYRPKFAEFACEYLASATLAQKKERTQDSERLAIARWVAHLGGVRVDKITPPIIYSYRERRLARGTSARTVNLDVIALRNVLKYARNCALIERLPETQQLQEKPPEKRPLFKKEELDRLFSTITVDTTKNYKLLLYYIQFLLYTGAREQETLALRWEDVNFESGFITIGRDPDTTKNGRQREVDFTDELEKLLREMSANRPPDTTWLFPSPQRGAKDVPAKTLRESMIRVREKAGLPKFGFHDLRHFFASQCVMAGLNFMSIADLLGHQDGGILVGSTYGHVDRDHRKKDAKALSDYRKGLA